MQYIIAFLLITAVIVVSFKVLIAFSIQTVLTGNRVKGFFMGMAHGFVTVGAIRLILHVVL